MTDERDVTHDGSGGWIGTCDHGDEVWTINRRTEHAAWRSLEAHAKDEHSTAYYCNHCGQTTTRVSGKRWIRSYCETSGKTTRLWRVTA